jgi:hypothetical protein
LSFSTFENEMRKFALIMTCLLIAPFISLSQSCFSPSTGYTCEDSVRQPDSYHHINEEYCPVCGCNNNTYRNSDAAYWWGGINEWSEGPCSNFDIDLYPNLFTPGLSGVGHLRIYMRNPGSASLVIYNAFGRKMYERLFSTSLSNAVIPEANPFDLNEAQSFPRGLYLVIVTVNDEQKVRKLLKVQE